IAISRSAERPTTSVYREIWNNPVDLLSLAVRQTLPNPFTLNPDKTKPCSIFDSTRVESNP
ncbi:MAG: hypothetical protein WDZ36_02490, partial [Balneolaceae bacterium]